jgi:hypothetical protein
VESVQSVIQKNLLWAPGWRLRKARRVESRKTRAAFMLQPFAISGVDQGMSMSHRGTVHRQHPWISGRSAVIVAGLMALQASGIRAEVSPVPADSLTSQSAASPSVSSSEAEASTEAAVPTHRYARIPKRNAFGIKPPAVAPPPEPEKEPPKERPDFFLTGFTSIRGEKRAFVAYQPKGKPVQYPRALLLEDEVDVADGVLKLVSIDPIEKTVTIAFNGEEIPLNFKDNAIKVTSSGAPSAPGAPIPGTPGSAPVLRGNQPPPPIMNPPAIGAGGAQPGFFPGAVQMGAAPTVIGRGGAILSGGSGTFQATPMTANAIQAGGAVQGGIDVSAIAPPPDQFGGTVPANPARISRNIPPPPPAPFPGQ